MNSGKKVLVVDGSRVVRATLRKHLSETYTVVEESDGESAWQTLMLDTGVCAVISGAHPPRLEACDLLARMRASSKRRLHTLPVLLIVSDVENHENRERDLAAGVADFITKSMSARTILDTLAGVIAHAAAAVHARPILNAEAFAEHLAHAAPNTQASVLVFALDNRQNLLSRFGTHALGRLDAHLANLIGSRLSASDVLGHAAPGRLGLLATGVEAAESARFARQLCKSLAQGQISVRGQAVPLTLSAGAAHSAIDRKAELPALLHLANARLDLAGALGGNTVVDNTSEPEPADWATVSNWLSGEIDRASAVRLAPSLYPLLAALDRELGLGLPLADINRRLQQVAAGS